MKTKQLLLAGALLTVALAAGCASDKTANNATRLHTRANNVVTNNAIRNNNRANTTATNRAIADTQHTIVNNALPATHNNTGVVTDRTNAVRYNEALVNEPLTIDGRAMNNGGAINNGTAVNSANLMNNNAIANNAAIGTTGSSTLDLVRQDVNNVRNRAIETARPTQTAMPTASPHATTSPIATMSPVPTTNPISTLNTGVVRPAL